MAPSLKDGDIVIYREFKGSKKHLISGCILILKSPIHSNLLIIKRLAEVKKEGILIFGDKLSSSTDSRHFGLVNYQNIIGIVEKVIPQSH
tara:strand:- start:24863 stop:25132 length:270 start_codon:yes stop_codon:yes gene_type:complete